MRNLLIGARSGEDRAAYPSAAARDADIEQGARASAKDLMADLAKLDEPMHAQRQDRLFRPQPRPAVPRSASARRGSFRPFA